MNDWKLIIYPPIPMTIETVDFHMRALQQMLTGTGESVRTFVSAVLTLESHERAIKLYDFIDLVLLLHMLPQPLERAHLCSRLKAARATGGMERPWTHNDDGQCSMPEVYTMIRDVFRSTVETNMD